MENRDRQLYHYYKKKCVVSGMDIICQEKFQLDQIQNGRLSAIILFNMRDIWEIVLDNKTITIKQNVRFQVRVYPEFF